MKLLQVGGDCYSHPLPNHDNAQIYLMILACYCAHDRVDKMDGELSIIELENTFIDDLNQLGDWFLQYEYLLAISGDMPHMTDEERTEKTKVYGCQTGVWLILDYSESRIHVRADSEALIIRGIISIVVSLFDGRTPEEVLAYTPQFIEETNIKKQISTDRFRGLHSVIETIQDFASKYC